MWGKVYVHQWKSLHAITVQLYFSNPFWWMGTESKRYLWSMDNKGDTVIWNEVWIGWQLKWWDKEEKNCVVSPISWIDLGGSLFMWNEMMDKLWNIIKIELLVFEIMKQKLHVRCKKCRKLQMFTVKYVKQTICSLYILCIYDILLLVKNVEVLYVSCCNWKVIQMERK